MSDTKTLSHRTWRCNYHIVFSQKYRRMIIYGKIKSGIGKILRKLYERKSVIIFRSQCLS